MAALKEHEPIVREPGRHYLLVETQHAGNPDSKLSRYLDELSPTRPGQFMYRMDSDRTRDTGDERLRLLSCTQEDIAAWNKAHEEDARGRLRRPHRETGDNSETTIAVGDHIL